MWRCARLVFGARPVRWFEGVPSPSETTVLQHGHIPRKLEDIAGIEYRRGSPEAQKLSILLLTMGAPRSAFRHVGGRQAGLEGKAQLVRKAIQAPLDQDPSVTLVHKGNIMKFTEGAFRDWGYELAQQEFGGKLLDGGPWVSLKNPNTGKEIVIKDVIADAMLQQILTRPKDYSVVATLNLNGDYLSDALAAQVGGIGIAPGGNINYVTGHAIFEATHGTAPKYANLDKVNPGSVILSGEMMLRYMGWTEA